MTAILMLGDTHGSRGFTRNAIRLCADNGIDAIYQLGDFGYWPRTNNGATFLHDVGKLSQELGIPLSFIDGNHEDHTMLRAVTDLSPGGRFEPVRITGKGRYPVWYLPRGYSWEVDGVRFGAFGGAFSVDRKTRSENNPKYGWFRTELPDPDEIDRLGKVDVLLTHDAPIIPPCMYGHNFKADETSRESQRVVYDALVRSGAKVLFHGHWHLNERYGVHGALVQGLAMHEDSFYDAACVFRTDDRRLFTLRQWEYRDAD